MTRIPEPQALALRRAVLAAGALAATLGAHALAVGGLRVLPVAPAAWAGLVAVAALLGPRRRFRPRGAGRTLAVAAALQALAHAVLLAAPWAAGVAGDHAGHAPAGAAQLIPHLAAAVLTAVLVARLERWLARAAALARAVGRWFAAAGAASAPRGRVAARAPRPARAAAAAPRRTRGPPPLRRA
ncbi:hypothetical protein [Miltoncostaea marina]|uniref:hypothetical protein n=1 Tax=Miltoncostaea marina TaxID=2843215 RepID=UPI001C3D4A7B|nr:hypothetical protein [Miltoncostaea marina]